MLSLLKKPCQKIEFYYKKGKSLQILDTWHEVYCSDPFMEENMTVSTDVNWVLRSLLKVLFSFDVPQQRIYDPETNGGKRRIKLK